MFIIPQNNSIKIPIQTNTFISPMALDPGNTPFYMLNNPLIRSPISYPNINNDPNLRKNMVNYFWNKLIDWFKESSLYKKILKNMYVVDNKVKMGIDNKPSDINNDTIKIVYILKEIINKKDLYDVLDKFCKINDVNYWDLQELHIKKYVKKYIYNKIKHLIINKN
jgi:hypothetical protein